MPCWVVKGVKTLHSVTSSVEDHESWARSSNEAMGGANWTTIHYPLTRIRRALVLSGCKPVWQENTQHSCKTKKSTHIHLIHFVQVVHFILDWIDSFYFCCICFVKLTGIVCNSIVLVEVRWCLYTFPDCIHVCRNIHNGHAMDSAS